MKEILNFRYYVLLACVAGSLIMILSAAPDDMTFCEWLAFHAVNGIAGAAVLIFAFAWMAVWWRDGKLPLLQRLQDLEASIADDDNIK